MIRIMLKEEEEKHTVPKIHILSKNPVKIWIFGTKKTLKITFLG